MSANALTAALNRLYPNRLDIEIVDLLTTHGNWPFKDAVNHYRIFTKYPWLWKISYEFVEFPTSRRFGELLMQIVNEESFRSAILSADPDVVVSVHPLCQLSPTIVVEELNERIKANCIDRLPVAFVTVVTDLINANQQVYIHLLGLFHSAL
jgi:1,2-diacylglycerol 3-beta-galactosyltransferase